MKQKLLLMMMALGMCSISMAQMTKELQVGDDGFKWYKTSKDGKVGAEDMDGNTIVPCNFRIIYYEGNQYDFQPKWFKVAAIDNSELFCSAYTIDGRCIIPISRHYNYINGWKKDKVTFYSFEKIGIGCGVCDVNGREVVFIEGINYIIPCDKNEDNKFFYNITKDKLWGVADGNGNIVIKPQYDRSVDRDIAFVAVSTTKNPLDIQEDYSINNSNNAFTGNISSTTPSVKELFDLAYNTPSSDAQLKYDRYQKVIQADPNNSYGYKSLAYINIGILYENLEDYQNAKEYYETALSVDPNNKNAKDNLKDVKRKIRNAKLDRISDALSAFGEALGGGQTGGSYNSYQGTGGTYVGSSGNSSSGSAGSNTRGSSSTISKNCKFCAGSGRCSGLHRCRGTGICNYCNGKKLKSTNGHEHECGACHLTGKCSFCGGTGKCKHCGGTGKG